VNGHALILTTLSDIFVNKGMDKIAALGSFLLQSLDLFCHVTSFLPFGFA
jgi:hypothetical protein